MDANLAASEKWLSFSEKFGEPGKSVVSIRKLHTIIPILIHRDDKSQTTKKEGSPYEF